MPERKFGVRRIETPELQGDDSYVVLRPLRRGDALVEDMLSLGMAKFKGREMDFNDKVIIQCVEKWNWVDDDGEPMPLPKDKPELLDDMPTAEYQFLVEEITGAIGTRLKK